jgi:hypothetical protein
MRSISSRAGSYLGDLVGGCIDVYLKCVDDGVWLMNPGCCPHRLSVVFWDPPSPGPHAGLGGFDEFCQSFAVYPRAEDDIWRKGRGGSA